MSSQRRALLFAICAVQALLALGFLVRWPPLTVWWPLPGTTPLTFVFVASIYAAVAASTAWVLVTRQTAALTGIGIDYVAILVPLAGLFVHAARTGGGTPAWAAAAASVAGALFGLWLVAVGRRAEFAPRPALPLPVRVSFAVFVVLLVAVGALLVARVPNVIPWRITPQLSVAIGCMFLGAATYFAYGLVRPCWANAGGQLAGFLAYDLVLVGPFVARLPTAPPEHRTGLWVYTAVVVYSGVLAAYYLFMHAPTRLWRVRISSSQRHAERGSR